MATHHTILPTQQVYPFANLADLCNPLCPRVLINRNPVHLYDGNGEDGFRFYEPDNYRDVFFEGDCDDGVCKLCDLLGW